MSKSFLKYHVAEISKCCIHDKHANNIRTAVYVTIAADTTGGHCLSEANIFTIG